MAWNGAGVFSLLYSWVARRDAGAPTHFIGATEMDAEFANVKGGLENCLTRTGETTAAANQPMGGFVHTNVGAATVRTNYARVAELQDSSHVYAAAGGTVDAITAAISPAPTAWTNGARYRVRASGANTSTTPTFTPNSGTLTAKTIVKGSNAALAVGDIIGNHHELDLVYNSTLDKVVLLNPASGLTALDLNALTTDATGGATGDFIPFVDVSDANASNKVTVQVLFDNVFANLAAITDGGATGDKLIVADASASNVAKTVTADNLIKTIMALLATDATGGAVDDLLAFVDTSEAGTPGNKVAVSDFIYNFLNNGTEDTTPDPDADHVLTRDHSASAYRKTLIKNLAVHANADSIGYKGAPVVTANASASFALTDAGKTWYHTDAGAHTFTIPANASVAFPVGTIILIENENGGGNVTIAITSDTLRWNSSTGSRTLAANGSACLKKVASTTWRLTGNGIS